MRYLLLGFLLVAGCAFNDSKRLAKLVPPPDLARQRELSPVLMRVVGGYDCGACQTNSPIINPSYPHMCHLEFDLIEQVNVIEVERSTNLIVWEQVYIDDPHLWIGTGHKLIMLTNTAPYASFRVGVRNTP